MLKSLREANPELAAHLQVRIFMFCLEVCLFIGLQRIRESDPSVRNLDLSSYLLAPSKKLPFFLLMVLK